MAGGSTPTNGGQELSGHGEKKKGSANNTTPNSPTGYYSPINMDTDDDVTITSVTHLGDKVSERSSRKNTCPRSPKLQDKVDKLISSVQQLVTTFNPTRKATPTSTPRQTNCGSDDQTQIHSPDTQAKSTKNASDQSQSHSRSQ